MAIDEKLESFCVEHGVTSKGSLSVVLQLTRSFSEDTLPIDPDSYRTPREGQVRGLGGANLKKILAENGITRTLASEGGRTSRGSMQLMVAYANFINSLEESNVVDFKAIEAFWVGKVRNYFTSQPLQLNSDSSKSIAASIDGLLGQAMKRQADNPGTQYMGTVLQHIVAAKLKLFLPGVEIHGADVADVPTQRGGDFVIGKTIIHCTTAPGAPLIEKCKANIDAGCNPIIITIFERVNTAQNLAADAGIGGRVEVWDVQQFVSTNVYEHELFNDEKRSATMRRIVETYNEIIDEYETDPSLRIKYE